MFRKLLTVTVILIFAGTSSASLVAYYPFDDYTADNQGGTAGAAANGSLENGADIIWGAGDSVKAPGPVADLTGDTDYIGCGGGNDGWGDLGDQVSVMAWYKVAGYNSNFATIVSKGTGESYGWSVNNHGTYQDVAFQCKSNPDWRGLPSLKPNSFDGQWHHVVGQFRGEGNYGNGWEMATGKIYIDGMLRNCAQRWGNLTYDSLDVLIGMEAGCLASGNPSWRNFYGWVDDVRIYDEFADKAEIWDIYVEGLVPEPATLILLGCGALTLLNRRQKR